MVSLNLIEQQLKNVGCNFRFWGRAEIRELCNIVVPGETIAKCVNGRYEGGFALLVVTDHRLLLIDRKPMFLTLEDLRFDLISEIDYTARLMNATVHVITPTRKLVFNSWSQQRLREVVDYTQAKVMEIRQHFMHQQLQIQQDVGLGSASSVGGMMLQGAGSSTFGIAYTPTINPYGRGSFMLRRRYPRFYS